MKRFVKYLICTAAVTVVLGGGYTLSAAAEENTDETYAVTTSVSTEVLETTTTLTDATEPLETDISETTVLSEITTETETEITSPETEPVPDGWFQKNGKWFYGTDGNYATGIVEIDGESYLFATNGEMKTGWQTVNSIRTFFDSETHSPVYGFVSWIENTYYNAKGQGKLLGMQEIDGSKYIFDDKTGIMQKGLVRYDNKIYCCDENGKILLGDGKKTPVDFNGTSYLIKDDGTVYLGWQTVNGLRVFFDYETGERVNGWVKYQGKYFYCDEIQGKYVGDAIIDDLPYRFGEGGAIMTGLQSFEGLGTSYFYEDGTRAYGFKEIDGAVYFFGETGYMETGWQTIGKAKYYFAKDGKMATGLYTVDGNVYYFAKDGQMQKGLLTIGKYLYYFDTDGTMYKGWKTVSDKTYYFGSDGKNITGWFEDGGEKYYLGKDGAMYKGFANVDEKTYYFGSDGKMRKGWQTIEKNKYYFGSDGVMYTYRHQIDGVNYIFYSNGILETGGNNTIVVKALSQLGNVGGEPYWTWWGFNFRIEWCACFVSWCAYQCGYTQTGSVPSFISCRVGIEWFQERGLWKSSSYTPKPGDYIFFDWEPDGVADHIGIVDYCENGIVYTVEGNSSDECRKRQYYVDDSVIFGYATPKFKN